MWRQQPTGLDCVQRCRQGQSSLQSSKCCRLTSSSRCVAWGAHGTHHGQRSKGACVRHSGRPCNRTTALTGVEPWKWHKTSCATPKTWGTRSCIGWDSAEAHGAYWEWLEGRTHTGMHRILRRWRLNIPIKGRARKRTAASTAQHELLCWSWHKLQGFSPFCWGTLSRLKPANKKHDEFLGPKSQDVGHAEPRCKARLPNVWTRLKLGIILWAHAGARVGASPTEAPGAASSLHHGSSKWAAKQSREWVSQSGDYGSN